MWLLAAQITMPALNQMPQSSGTALIYIVIACFITGIGVIWWLLKSTQQSFTKTISIFEQVTERVAVESKKEREVHEKTVEKIMETHEKLHERQGELFERTQERQRETFERAIDRLTDWNDGKTGRDKGTG